MKESDDDQARVEEMHMSDGPSHPGVPRWVKVFGIIVIVVVLLAVAVMFVGGEHGPGRHTPSGDAGGRVLSSGVLGDLAPPEGGRG